MKTLKRPLFVTCLAALVLILTATQLLRACIVLGDLAFYSETLGAGYPLFFIVSGLVWGGLGLWLALALWRGRSWVPKSAKWGMLAFFAFGWFDRLVLQANGPQRVNWPFQFVVTTALLVVVFASFSLPQSKAFFGEKNERPLKN